MSSLRIAALALVVPTLGIAASAHAHQLGYVDVDKLLAELPEMERVEAELGSLSEERVAEGKQMAAAYQARVAQAEARVRQGLSPEEQDELRTALAQQEMKIREFDVQIQRDLQKKREDLLRPVFESVKIAIAEVARENGLDFVLKREALLYGDGARDVSGLVKAKLGIAQSVDSERAALLNEEGKKLWLREKDLRSSLTMFSEAVRLDPKGRYFFNLCYAHHQLGEYQAARKVCLEVAPNTDDPDLERRAQILLDDLQARLGPGS